MDRGYGDFYMFNLHNVCAQKYKAYINYKRLSLPSTNLDHSGVVYDGLMADEMLGGAAATLIHASTGGKIVEYGDKTAEEIAAASSPDQYSNDQASIIGAIKTNASLWLGHDFLFLPNMAESVGSVAAKALANAAGGELTEMYSGENMQDNWGEKGRWDLVNSETAKGHYFVWAQRDPDRNAAETPNFTASNYAGAKEKFYDKNTKKIEIDSSGFEARHGMLSLVSYLMAKDRNSRTLYTQKGWENDSWNFPLSNYWMKAREMDIGQPVATTENPTGSYYLWKSSLNYKSDYSPNIPNTTLDNNNTLTQSDGRVHAAQPVVVYKKDYDNAIVLFRTFSDNWSFCIPDPSRPGHNLPDPANSGSCLQSDWNYGAQSEQFDLGGNYHVLYPDGTQGPIINKLSLAIQEGVVLIPDGYDPMAGGTITQPVSTNAKITMSDGGVHNTGDTFPVTVDLDTKGQTICATTLNITFPKDKIAYESATLGSIYSLDILSTTDNANGTMTYNLGASRCSTQNSTLLTINFRAISSGTGNIGFSSVKVVGGTDKTNVVDITTDTSGTSVTINGSPIVGPTTTLTVNNGAAPNGSGWYTTAPVFKLAATSSGSTISNIKYHWDTDAFTTINGSTTDNITAPEGAHTITFYATDAAGNAEAPKTQTFQVDTNTPVNPTIDQYNPMTYKPTYLLKGTKDTKAKKVFGVIYTEDPKTNTKTVISPHAEIGLSNDSWSKNIDLVLAPETYTCTDPSTQLSRDDCVRAKATKVDLTTTNQAGTESLPLTVNITRHMLGDMDGDMVVGAHDLFGIKANWLGASINVMSDMNNNGDGDGKCDLYDFGTLLANWTEE